MIVLEILALILFWLVMLGAIVAIPFGIPGTFIIVLNAFTYGWLTSFLKITWGFLTLLLLISVIAEVIEFMLGAATAAKYGASKFGMIGAIVGGFVGAIWATPIMPLLGTLFGAFFGAFVGATAFEYIKSQDLEKSVQAGLGAFLGSVGGKLTKVAVAVAMTVMVGFRLI